jgi:hypothetical protein
MIDNASAHTLFPRMELIFVQGDERVAYEAARVGTPSWATRGRLAGDYLMSGSHIHSDIGSQIAEPTVASTGE